MFAFRYPSIANRLRHGVTIGASGIDNRAGAVLTTTQNFHSPSYKRYLRKENGYRTHDPPTSERQMNNESLITLGSIGNLPARKELLKRHIMSTDRISYKDACLIFEKIEQKNLELMFLMALPYRIGIGVAVGAAVGSIPLVFDFDTVHWFNEAYVTADVPEPKDLETWLEVGAWSWNWMEPVMGQISFALLCLQVARNQLNNLGNKPYTKMMKNYRAKRVARAFPQYNRDAIMNYSKAAPFVREEPV